MGKALTEKREVNPTDKDLDRAIRRVYQIYGPNLAAFFLAVQNQLKQERKESQKREAQVQRHG